MNWPLDILKFHKKFSLRPFGEKLRRDRDLLKSRASRIEEECGELLDALRRKDWKREELAQEGVDVIYSVLGMFVELGIDPDRCWAEVHRANMAKEGVLVTSIVKPDGWKGPDMAAVLR